MSDQVEAMACAVCAEPLFSGRSGGEVVVWLHRAELTDVWPETSEIPPAMVEEIRERLRLSRVDHMAVPVPIDQVQAETKCDFCSGPRPRWLLPVEAFEANAQQAFTKDWAMCEVCARLVKKGRWDGVLQRAIDTASVKYDVSPQEPSLVEGLKGFLAQVREYQVGPPRRADD